MTQPLGSALLLNYNADERASYRQALIDAGFDVIVCVDPLEALRAAVSRRPDAVVTRLAHPHCPLNGVEFIKRLKADRRTAAIHVTVTLSLAEARYIAEAKSAGADECLLLPSSADDVAQAVKRVVTERADWHRRSA
jgi:CheY-like chemotaxis protein